MLTREEEDSILSASRLAAGGLLEKGLSIVKSKPWWKQSHQKRQGKRKHPNQTDGDHTHSLYPQEQPPTGY